MTFGFKSNPFSRDTAAYDFVRGNASDILGLTAEIA